MYELYKPFRNRLRQYWVVQGLEVVYRFIQWLEFDRPLPPELNAPALPQGKMERMTKGIIPWEFELLARELILNADKHRAQRTLVSYPEVARNINDIKYIEDQLWPIHSVRDDDVLYELVRIAHRQFPWQRGLSRDEIVNYLRLYESEELSRMFAREYGMSAREFFQLTFALAGLFKKNFGVRLPIRNELNDVPDEICSAFVERFSMTLDEAKTETAKYQEYNINWPYTFNPLRARPLLRLSENEIICPVTPFLLRRGTSEVYFDLVRHGSEFSQRYGPAFQRVVGEAAQRLSNNTRMRVLAEARYGTRSKPKDSVDWIVEDDSASLFVECKGSRVHYRGISDLTDRGPIDAEFARVRGFCRQLYRSLADALQGKYPHWKPSGGALYPLIVTLEEWETFGVKVVEQIIAPLRDELRDLGLDPDLVTRHPPSFCSLSTFDAAVYVCGRVGVKAVFERKVVGENQQWALDTYLTNQFRDILLEREAPTFHDDWLRFASRIRRN